MSVGRQPLVVNVGPGRGFEGVRPATFPAERASTGPRRRGGRPAHSTVEVDGASSAGLRGRRAHRRPDAGLGAPGAGRDRHVAARDPGRLRGEQGPAARAAHLRRRPRRRGPRRGNPQRHRRPRPRRLRPRRSGGRRPRRASPPGSISTPTSRSLSTRSQEAALLTLPDGETWEFRAGGGASRSSPRPGSTPDAAAPRPSQQVVVRAEVVEYLGQITWSFGRIGPASRAGAAPAAAEPAGTRRWSLPDHVRRSRPDHPRPAVGVRQDRPHPARASGWPPAASS